MQVSIWDDSQCTVEEDYTSLVLSKTPKKSVEFKNSLITNKGDISTARKISNDVTQFRWSGEEIKMYSSLNICHVSLDESEDSVSDEGGVDISNFVQVKKLSEVVRKNKESKRMKSWKEMQSKQTYMTSLEIMKKIT